MGHGGKGKARRQRLIVPMGEVHPYGVKLITKLMKDNNIGYDCELFDVTQHMDGFSTRELEEKRLWTTDEIIKTINHIKDNRLLG